MELAAICNEIHKQIIESFYCVNIVRENVNANKINRSITWKLRNDTTISSVEGIKDLEEYWEHPQSHANTPSKLLNLVVRKNDAGKSPFSSVEVSRKDYFSLGITDVKELNEWAKILEEKKFIEITSAEDGKLKLKPLGLIESEKRGLNQRRVFIAMQFSDWDEFTIDRSAILESIKNACIEAGNFEASCVDEEPHTEKICDRILALINQSQFVIADLTFNNQGVYFEAGYALGQQKDVIFLVHEPFVKGESVHFDTRQYNQIRWGSPEDLKKKLKDHIEAFIERKMIPTSV